LSAVDLVSEVLPGEGLERIRRSGAAHAAIWQPVARWLRLGLENPPQSFLNERAQRLPILRAWRLARTSRASAMSTVVFM
jgi:hypothetical protein